MSYPLLPSVLHLREWRSDTPTTSAATDSTKVKIRKARISLQPLGSSAPKSVITGLGVHSNYPVSASHKPNKWFTGIPRQSAPWFMSLLVFALRQSSLLTKAEVEQHSVGNPVEHPNLTSIYRHNYNFNMDSYTQQPSEPDLAGHLVFLFSWHVDVPTFKKTPSLRTVRL